MNRLLIALITFTSLSPLTRAQGRTEVTVNDTSFQAENLTSSQDGSVYFGSMTKGNIYRAAPGAAQAESWIQGLTSVAGLLADDKTNTLWVCQNSSGGRGAAPVVGQTALRSFDLKSGAAKGTYPFPSSGGVCNDMAIAPDGTVYATESFANRVHRLKPGATALDLWVTDQRFGGIDGVALLADGAVYVNTFFGSELFRIPVNPDGSAGTVAKIETSMPLGRPDGLRTIGPRTLIQAEGQGRVAELTIDGNHGAVRVVKDGLQGASGVTIVGDTALVLVGGSKAVVVPYAPSSRGQSVGTRAVSLAEGKRLYDANCANCHGPRAQGAVKAGIDISIIAERGGKQPPDLTDAAWDHGSTDADIVSVVKKGIPSGMMAPYEGRLSDADIENVVAYVRSLASPQAPSAQGATPAGRAAAPAPQSPERTLELADYAELPVTGDQSTNLISGQLARGSILRDEPGGNRFFVNDLNGPLYILNKQTKQFTQYLNFKELFPKFTSAQGFAAGLMNFAFDPDYARNGVFYTLHMENPAMTGESALPKAGVVPGLNLAGYTTSSMLQTPIVTNVASTREMVIVEWTDRQIGNTTFEGTAREVLRMQLPGIFHPLNEITFNPAARPGDPEWRVMYLGVGDSGTGERPGPMRLHAQRLDTLHGKILRIIPMLSEHVSTSTVSENGRYRIPNDNPFVSLEGARKEIWALGLRNPHRLTWYTDPARPRDPVLLAFNIGLVSWETVMIIKKGANYGYPLREGTQSMSATNGMGPIPVEDMIPVQLSDTVTRGTVKPTYAVAAYPHTAAAGGDAIANGFVYRGKRIPALQGTLVFGDITTGRIWYAQMKEVLAADDGNPLTLAPLHELGAGLRALSEAAFKRRGGQGDSLPGFGAVAGRGRVDIRLAEDRDGELFVLTKGDGMIREFRSVR